MTEMPACLLVGQNRGDQQTLINLDATAIALEASRISREFLLAWHQARDGVRSIRDKLLDSDVAGSSFGQEVIEAFSVIAQKLDSGFARGISNLLGGCLLTFAAAVGTRQHSQQTSGLQPVIRKMVAIFRIGARQFRLRPVPG